MDSLNNFFRKAGDQLSFGNKMRRSKPPKGSLLHSGIYYGPGDTEGVTRTQGGFYITNPNPSPGQNSNGVSLIDENHRFGINKTYPPGFTPVSYYKTSGLESEIIIIPEGKNPMGMGEKFESNTSTLNGGVSIGGLSSESQGRDGIGGFDDASGFDFKYGLNKYENWPGGSVPLPPKGKNEIESFDGSYGSKSWEKNDNYEFSKSAVAWSNGTPYENEDPVFFGFEVVIDSLRSPLLNGELDNFLDTMSNNTEISSRKEISNSFKLELSKFFKFNKDVISDDNLFGVSSRKRHYIKKISGIDKLIETNESNKSKSFVSYRDDLIKISFYEDTTLSTGTLASLYKLLYWSRIHGKGIVPENLLRFDCEIIVSEVRNIGRVRKAISEGQSSQYALEILKENVSRYVYSAYECQFFFPRMTHSDQIDLESITPQSNWEIDMNFKFSNMRFERFKFDESTYKSINDRRIDPTSISPSDPNSTIGENVEGSILVSKTAETPVRIRPIVDNLSSFDDGDTSSVAPTTLDDIIVTSKSNFKRRALDKIKDALSTSSENLLNSIKKAGMTEAQRQLNNQFRLLNNAIDQVRNAYGIGRMSEPTNVYKRPPGGSNFFFDVRNSLRNFGGDLLGGLL